MLSHTSLETFLDTSSCTINEKEVVNNEKLNVMKLYACQIIAEIVKMRSR